MATIRPQQIGAVNYGDSNALLQAGQRLLASGLGNIGDVVNTLRQNVVDRNTAAAVGAITGAQNLQDLAARQNQVQNILSNANGDIDTAAVQRAQLAMPDTLMTRQSNQNRLTQFDQEQHDTPLINQALTLYANGDAAGAAKVLQGVQGDASRAITFGANRADQARQDARADASLAIQRQGLALRQAAATTRAAQQTAGAKQVQSLLKAVLGNNATASQEDTQAAVKFQNQQLSDAEKSNPLNNPKANVSGTVSNINDANNNWWWFNSDRGTALQKLATDLPGYANLTDSQKVNLLNGMNSAFDSADGSKDKAAQDWAKDAIDSLQKNQASQLRNTQTQIRQKRDSNNQRAQLLLGLLQGNGSMNPLATQLLNIDDED